MRAPTTHAPLDIVLRPSGASRWWECPASPRYIASLNVVEDPRKAGGASDEGTCAHYALHLALKHRKLPQEFIGTKCPVSTLAITQKMADDTTHAVDYIWSHTKDIYTEVGMRIPELNGQFEPGTGTPDGWWIEGDTLVVMDYKNGTIPVYAANNKQMMIYGGAVIRKHLALMREHGISFVRLVIVQPNCRKKPEAIDFWEIHIGHMVQFIKDELPKRVARCHDPKAPFVPGDSQCQFCPGRDTCVARANQMVEQAGLEFADLMQDDSEILSDPEAFSESLSLSQRSKIYQRASAVRAWISAIEAKVWRDTQAGKKTGFKFVEGKSNRKWEDETKAANELIDMGLPVEEVAPRKLLGLGAIKGALRVHKKLKPVDADKVIDKLTTKPPGTPKLVDEADPRPTYNDARVDFADLIQEE